MAATRHATHTRANMFGLARHAKHYERWAGRLATPLYRRVVADVAAAQLPGGAFVLDVGSGPGRVLMMIAERCPQLSVSGIDLSPEMMARATVVAARRSGGHPVEFQVADVVALPFADQSMDLVVSSISLHHWDDPAAGLRDIIRVLRPGAQAWIYDIRPMVRRAAPMSVGLDADQRMEVPLIGSLPINPIGRLVLTRHSSADE